MPKRSSGPYVLEHTGANAECIYIKANSGARKTRSFHKHATKTGSKGENFAVFGNSRTLFVQAFLTNAKNKNKNLVMCNLSTARASDQTQGSQDSSSQMYRYRLYRQGDAQGTLFFPFLLRKSDK